MYTYNIHTLPCLLFYLPFSQYFRPIHRPEFRTSGYNRYIFCFHSIKCLLFNFFSGRKRRDERRFPGASAILKQLSDGARRKRVGLVQTTQGAPARGGAVLFNPVNGEKIGSVTSGCPSPTLSQNIAMGYVDSRFVKNGTDILAEVRGQKIPMVITKIPFVKANYYSKPK